MSFRICLLGIFHIMLFGLGNAAMAEMTITEQGNVNVGTKNSPSDLTVYGVINDTFGPILPKGVIVMWSGEKIPDGWALCDGTKQTPDLSGRFVVGLKKGDSDYKKISNTGGSDEISLRRDQMPLHSHNIQHDHTLVNADHTHGIPSAGNNGNDATYLSRTSFAREGQGPLINHTTAPEQPMSVGPSNLNYSGSVGGSRPFDNRPAYFVIAYIMKL